MKKLDKLAFLKSLDEQTESHLTQAIRVFQNLDEQDLNRRPAGGGWSIAECLEHLNTYYRYYLPLLEEGIRKGMKNNAGSYASSWLGRYFQKMMDPDRGRGKYKAAGMHQPVPHDNGYAVVAEFIDFQERLSKILTGMRDIDINAVRIPISLSSLIRLNAGDTVAFLVTHDERHIRQANRHLSSAFSTGLQERRFANREESVV
ncbi:MAG TPA: DinB family protein [Sphingobacteriaceae bacterium]